MPSTQESISSNPLRTRDDLQAFLEDLLKPLEPHTSPGGALIRLGNTGTHFDERAAQLEGFSRPLWGLASLLAGGGSFPGTARWVKGFASGTNPDHDEFWGNMRDRDQRMVECAAIGYTLAVAREAIWDPLDADAKKNLEQWLGGMNDKKMPDTNWLWFRVFSNLGLSKVGSTYYSASRLKADLDHLDTFYLGQGWSRDGPEGVLQLDYYSSSFAIQFAQLVYSKLAAKEDPVRAKAYRERASLFAMHFVHYFDAEGPAIPFGRSSTYRFAQASFWGALAFADVEPGGPLTWGVIKGLLLRNLRYWTKQPFLDAAGIVTLGYVYPNHNILENYNSPGSTYWCCKAFAPLALPASHPFWAAAEEAYPPSLRAHTIALEHPLHLVTNMGDHAFLLSSGQKCHYPLRHSAHKYGKLAYSASFGFSVLTGSESLEEIGGDSTLALSDDGGATWRMRQEPLDARIEEGKWLRSSWRPWPDVEVETWLLAPTEAARAWHVRVHRVKTQRNLKSAEGGWAIYGQGKNARALERFVGAPDAGEGTEEGAGSALAHSSAGVSGIADLGAAQHRRAGRALRQDPNSNLIAARTVLPTLVGEHNAGEEWLITGVLGIPVRQEGSGVREGWIKEWEGRPVIPEALRSLIPNF